VKREDSLDPPLERFLLRNGSQTTERGLRSRFLIWVDAEPVLHPDQDQVKPVVSLDPAVLSFLARISHRETKSYIRQHKE
jgi:hypothetical protein